MPVEPPAWQPLLVVLWYAKMNSTEPDSSAADKLPLPIPTWLRFFLVAMSVFLSVLLAIGWYLQPDSRGFGTHHQLGFPSCTFISLWGIPCPMCGMTTSWSHLMHGNLTGAFHSNPGGALLGLTSMLAIPICSWRAWVGVATENNWLSRFTLLWLCLVIFVIGLFWIWQIQFRSFLY